MEKSLPPTTDWTFPNWSSRCCAAPRSDSRDWPPAGSAIFQQVFAVAGRKWVGQIAARSRLFVRLPAWLLAGRLGGAWIGIGRSRVGLGGDCLLVASSLDRFHAELAQPTGNFVVGKRTGRLRRVVV